MEFVSEARQCEEKCYGLVQSDNEKCRDSIDSTCGRRRGTWSIVRYMEKVRASSGLVKDCTGELMTKLVYQEFALTARGGRKSAAEADAQCEKWEKDVEKGVRETLHDFKGAGGSA